MQLSRSYMKLYVTYSAQNLICTMAAMTREQLFSKHVDLTHGKGGTSSKTNGVGKSISVVSTYAIGTQQVIV
jgi:hypothetical protein